MIRKSFTYKKIKTIVKSHCRRKVGRAHGSRFKAYSIQIPYHRLPFWYNFEYSLLKTIGLFQFDFQHSFWSICIRIPWRIWADLCMIFYLPLSTEMRSICIHVMNDFSFLWCLAYLHICIFTYLHICVSRDLFWRILRFQAARITFQIKMVVVRYIYFCLMVSEI